MKNFRKTWGLTQEELAALIGVTRGMLAMYETGRRQLPTPASIKLAELHLLLQQPTTRKIQPATLQQRQAAQLAKAEKLLNARARKAALDAAHATHILDKMQLRYRQLQQKMALIQTALPAAPPNTLQQSALRYMEARVGDEMERFAPARQVLIAYKLVVCTALQQAAGVARKMIR